MNKKGFLLAACTASLVTSSGLSASACDVSTTFSVETGYKRGTTKHNVPIYTLARTIYLDGSIQHKMKYNVWDLQAISRTLIDNSLYIKANLGWGHIFKASETMNCDGVTAMGGPLSIAFPNVAPILSSKRNVRKKHGQTLNASLALGYAIPINDNLQLIPIVGVSHQSMQLKRYMDTKDYGVSSSNTKQKERWNSVFFGLEALVNLDCGLKIVSEVQYHFAKYKNSYSNFKNRAINNQYYYQGKAKRGSILVLGVKGFVPLNDQWSFDLGYQFSCKRAKPDFQTDYIANPKVIYKGKAKKARVKNQEHHWNFGFTYLF